MRCSRFVGLALFSAVLVLAFAGSALAAPAGWNVSQISSMTGGVGYNAIDVAGNRVVWLQQIAGGNVWTWTPTEAAHQVSDDEGIRSAPVVSSTGRIAWTGHKTTDGADSIVRTWAPGSGIATVGLSPTFDSEYGPVISGERIVWATSMPLQPQGQIYEWMKPSSVATVSENPYGVYWPSVSAERTAWYGSSGKAYQVYTRKADDSAPTQLTNHVTGVAYYPDCSDTYVVWTDQDESDNWTVRAWRASDDTSMSLGRCSYGAYPKVSGDRVAWIGLDEGLHTQVFTWKNGVTTTITAGTLGRDEVAVDGDRVAWVEAGEPYDEIYTWRVGDASPTHLSDGTASCHAPNISGDRVVWTEYVNGAYQVFSAVPYVEQAPIATSLTKPSVSPGKPTHGKYATFSTYLRPGGGGVGAKVTLKLSQQLTKSVRKKVGRKWRTVKVKYWKLRKTVNINGTGAEKFSTSVKLAYKGSWKAEVSATIAAGYSTPAKPKALTFTVK